MAEERGYITPIPIRSTAIPSSPTMPARRPHAGGICTDSCKYLTSKEHEKLAYLESGHMELLKLQSTLWFEFVRLKELSDQVDKWRTTYSTAIDILISRAISRNQIQLKVEVGVENDQQSSDT